MERKIIHSDINNCFASIELKFRPELQARPVAVGGSEKSRHGIILAKNYEAKKYGVKTAEPIWEAVKKCPDLVILPPHYELYAEYSRRVRAVYERYTDYIEPFGIDEAWVDLTGWCRLFHADAEKVAFEIKEQVKREVGITVSVGLADNKIFAKLGSDMKKPDGLTVITPENFREKVWPLPASDLLFVGPASAEKLKRHCIRTIGDIANADVRLMRSYMGSAADELHAFANGLDRSPVRKLGFALPPKSVSNSMTPLRDLQNREDVRMLFCLLADSVARRLREAGFRSKCVQIHLRDTSLTTVERQTRLARPTCVTNELLSTAMSLFEGCYTWLRPLRSIGIAATELVPIDAPLQLNLLTDEECQIRRERAEAAADEIRRKYGKRSIAMCSDHQDPSLVRSRSRGFVFAKSDVSEP